MRIGDGDDDGAGGGDYIEHPGRVQPQDVFHNSEKGLNRLAFGADVTGFDNAAGIVQDNYFGGKGLQAAGINKKQADALGRRAIAGAFRSAALNPGSLQLPDVRNGQSPLRVMRTEPTGKK